MSLKENHPRRGRHAADIWRDLPTWILSPKLKRRRGLSLRRRHSLSLRSWGGVPASIWRFPCINRAWSRVLTPANRVSVANPDVADIVVISPIELYVLGKDVGTTNVLLGTITVT